MTLRHFIDPITGERVNEVWRHGDGWRFSNGVYVSSLVGTCASDPAIVEDAIWQTVRRHKHRQALDEAGKFGRVLNPDLYQWP